MRTLNALARGLFGQKYTPWRVEVRLARFKTIWAAESTFLSPAYACAWLYKGQMERQFRAMPLSIRVTPPARVYGKATKEA